MIRKIICPTDFSSASENAVHYAAHLCQNLGTSLELVTVESAYLTSMMIAPVYSEQKNLTTIEMQEYVCDRIKSSYNIACDHELFISNHSLAHTLERHKAEEKFVVMGTAAKQSFFKRLTGSNTYRFIRETAYPLLIVPENVSYHGLQNIVLSIKDPSRIHSSVLDLIKSKNNSHITDLQVYQHETSDKKIKKATSGYNNCEPVFSSNTFRGIHHYMLYTQADLLVVVGKQRGFLGRVFHSSIIKKLSRQNAYPVLVLK